MSEHLVMATYAAAGITKWLSSADTLINMYTVVCPVHHKSSHGHISAVVQIGYTTPTQRLCEDLPLAQIT